MTSVGSVAGALAPADIEHCRDIVREGNRDLFLASLFLPKPHREAAFVLQAFFTEIAAIPLRVSEPLPGEVRLQWWREVIGRERDGEAEANPLSRALLAIVKTHRIPPSALTGMLEAREFDLYSDPMPDVDALETWAGQTWSALLQLTCLTISPEMTAATAECAGHAGVAMACERILADLPRARARHRQYLPADLVHSAGVSPQDYFAGVQSREADNLVAMFVSLAQDHMAKARAAVAALPQVTRPVFLPLCLVEKSLRKFEATGAKTLTQTPLTPQWRRQIALWRAARGEFRGAA